MRALVVGGSPEVVNAKKLRTLVKDAELTVAVDRGLDALMSSGLSCDLYCGDADSVSQEGREELLLAEQGRSQYIGAYERYNPHKDYTDLELALRAIRARCAHQVRLVATCLHGGAPDHFLGVLGRLEYVVRCWGWQVILAENYGRGWVLSGEAQQAGFEVGSRFSFIPLSATAVVSECGMRWNLDHQEVAALSDLGISNVIESPSATFSLHQGSVAVWEFPQSR